MISLLPALLLVSAFGQNLPPGLKMHRVQAGEPDSSGWMLAKSTEGGFSVRLPLKFNDFTIVESDPAAPVARTFTVGVKSQEGIKFSATRVVYRKGAESARYFFSRFEKGEGFDVKPERSTPRMIGDRRAVDLVLRRQSDVSYQRAVLLDSDLVLMIIEAPRGQDAVAQQFVTPFFDSLMVSSK